MAIPAAYRGQTGCYQNLLSTFRSKKEKKNVKKILIINIKANSFGFWPELEFLN